MRRLGFLAKELKKKFSLVKAQRGLFGFGFFFQFDKRTDKCVTYTAQYSTSLERNINFA